jgi:hypothetical protein
MAEAEEALVTEERPDLVRQGRERLGFMERSIVRFVRGTFEPGVTDRSVRFLQRVIGSTWIHHFTKHLRHVYGEDRLPPLDPEQSFILVSNHRSFFDLYVVFGHLNLVDTHLPGALVGHQGCRFGAELEQAVDSVRSLALGACLEHLAESDERDDHARGLEKHIAMTKYDSQRVEVGGKRAKRDQRVHVGAALPGETPPDPVVPGTNVEDDRRDENSLDDRVPQLMRAEKVQDHRRGGESGSNPELATLFSFFPRVHVDYITPGFIQFVLAEGIADLVDGGDQRGRVGAGGDIYGR